VKAAATKRIDLIVMGQAPGGLAGQTVPSLAPEDLLLILCVHGVSTVGTA
jgi:hypothetical protein